MFLLNNSLSTGTPTKNNIKGAVENSSISMKTIELQGPLLIENSLLLLKEVLQLFLESLT